MLNTDKQMTVKRRDFEFPLSVTEFSIDETARVATYTYAGMDGALHERVMQYRIITMSGMLSEFSWTDFDQKTPEQYVHELQKTNDNKAGLLYHPTFWTYSCIIKSMKLNHRWDDTEADLVNNVLPGYSFDIEFWEMAHSNSNNNMDKFYPAISVRPPADLYKNNLRYHTCTELYQAILDGLILPWLDPITNAEWLKYDYTLRKCAYDRYVANPNGENYGTVFDSKWNIKAATSSTPKTSNSSTQTNSNQKTYTVKVWDTATSIAKKFWIKVNDLFNMNKGRKVRTSPFNLDLLGASLFRQWLYRTLISYLQAGDVLLVPDNNSLINSNIYVNNGYTDLPGSNLN
jgi:hypothetical protein